MNMQSELFETLYDVKGIMTGLTAESVPHSVSSEGNLAVFGIELNVDVSGIKWVKATLSGAWNEETGKGFFTHFVCRASATVGDTRQKTIIDTLYSMFQSYELDVDQPEGIYEQFGSWNRHVYMIRKIDGQDVIPLYKATKEQYGRTEETLYCRYQQYLVETSSYAHDFIDEAGNRYSILREITKFEDGNKFVFCVPAFREGYRAFPDVKERDSISIEVFHECVNARPPQLPVGTVLYDNDEHQYARIIEEDGELHLQYERSDRRGTFDPFVLSSKYKVIPGGRFEFPADGIYFDKTNRYIYRAIAQRPNYLVVQPAHRGTFEPRTWREEPQKRWIVPKQQLVKLDIDFDRYMKHGSGYMETPIGKVISDLFQRSNAAIDDQVHFWVGLAVDHYGNLNNALHEVYFAFIQRFKYTSSNNEELTDYVQTLFAAFVEQDVA